MNRSTRQVLSAVVLLALEASGANAGIIVKTACQKNLGDGRVLVQDYTTLPSENSTYKVVRFKASRIEDDWAYGPCVLDATR